MDGSIMPEESVADGEHAEVDLLIRAGHGRTGGSMGCFLVLPLESLDPRLGHVEERRARFCPRLVRLAGQYVVKPEAPLAQGRHAGQPPHEHRPRAVPHNGFEVGVPQDRFESAGRRLPVSDHALVEDDHGPVTAELTGPHELDGVPKILHDGTQEHRHSGVDAEVPAEIHQRQIAHVFLHHAVTAAQVENPAGECHYSQRGCASSAGDRARAESGVGAVRRLAATRRGGRCFWSARARRYRRRYVSSPQAAVAQLAA